MSRWPNPQRCAHVAAKEGRRGVFGQVGIFGRHFPISVRSDQCVLHSAKSVIHNTLPIRNGRKLRGPTPEGGWSQRTDRWARRRPRHAERMEYVGVSPPRAGRSRPPSPHHPRGRDHLCPQSWRFRARKCDREGELSPVAGATFSKICHFPKSGCQSAPNRDPGSASKRPSGHCALSAARSWSKSA
jgi:hypothetical protein